MNTRVLKQRAIAMMLGWMFEFTCVYTPDVDNRWGTPIEPDVPNLNEFRILLAELARLHQDCKLTVDDLQDAKKFVRKVGFEHGHVTGSYLTGTWGVRYSELGDIIEMLNMPDGELLPVGATITMYGNDYKIEEYKISQFHLGVYISPENDDSLERPWSFTVAWDSITDIMPGGMYERKEK